MVLMVLYDTDSGSFKKNYDALLIMRSHFVLRLKSDLVIQRKMWVCLISKSDLCGTTKCD